jgi:transcriptional regulator with XRE-family HTH domain
MAKSIGTRIKSLRIERGLTLAGLGEKSTLSTSYLSQIERDKSMPSIGTLAVIAQVLDVAPRFFFENETELVFMVDSNVDAPGEQAAGRPRHRRLSPGADGNKLGVSRVSVEPLGSSGPLPTFAGEELLFVLDGRLEIVVGGESHSLGEGDSIHYDTEMPHCWTNRSEGSCTMLLGRVGAPLDLGPNSCKEGSEEEGKQFTRR